MTKCQEVGELPWRCLSRNATAAARPVWTIPPASLETSWTAPLIQCQGTAEDQRAASCLITSFICPLSSVLVNIFIDVSESEYTYDVYGWHQAEWLPAFWTTRIQMMLTSGREGLKHAGGDLNKAKQGPSATF